MLTWISLALAAPLPHAEVSWKGDAAVLLLEGPAGEHVAPDASAAASLRWDDRELAYAGLGDALVEGVPLRGVRGAELTGTVTLSLCVDGGTLCRMADVAVAGTIPTARKGRVALAVSEVAARAPEPVADPYRKDAGAVVAEAFARAEAEGLPVLLDFTAVWCPPCNLMSAEVLEAPEHQPLLEEFVLAQVDVDDPSSWEVKARYQVGGYPTVIVAGADQAELDRLVGYPGAEETLAFLRGTLSPEAEAPAAAERALSLVQEGDEEAARAALAEAEDGVSLRLARVQLDPNLDDARWLAEHAPGRALEWTWAVRDVIGEEGRPVLAEAIRRDLRAASGAEAADLLYVLSKIEPEHRATYLSAAVAALRAWFSGDPHRDRGQYTWMAELLAQSGDVQAALAFLDEARATFPDEPTWDLAAAGILVDAERHADALARAEAGLPLAWGDNLLRLATVKAECLKALGRTEEARRYAASVLATSPEPPEGLEVRTHRYRARLAALLEDESASGE